jgi:hypothetical protein
MGALGAAYILDRSSTHLVGQIMDAAWRFWKGWLTGEPSPARSAAARLVPGCCSYSGCWSVPP